MLLPRGSCRVEASAEGYETATESMARRIALRIEGPKAGEQFTDCAEPLVYFVPMVTKSMPDLSIDSPMRRLGVQR